VEINGVTNPDAGFEMRSSCIDDTGVETFYEEHRRFPSARVCAPWHDAGAIAQYNLIARWIVGFAAA